MKKNYQVKFLKIMVILTLVCLTAGVIVMFSNKEKTETIEYSVEEKVHTANSNDTEFEEFIKADGTKYNATPNVKKVTDLEEKEVLYGSYQFNYTAAASTVSTVLRNSTIDQQWYSKLSTLDGYEWLAQFENDAQFSSIKDSSGNQLVRGNSSGGELKKYNSGDKIYKAYLVLAERYTDNTRKLLSEFPVTLVGPNGKYIKTRPAEIRHAGKERYSAYIDVTEFVKNQGYGWYYCCNVPYYYSNSFSSDQYSSWKLIVIEENADLPLRALTLKLGYISTSNNTAASVAINSKNIKTKAEGEVTGQILYSLEGADISPESNVLSLVVDGTTQKDFYKETGSTSVLRTDVVPVIERYTRNNQMINTLMNFDSAMDSIETFTKRTYTNNSKTYTLQGKMSGADVEILDIDAAKTYSNLSIGNSKQSITFKFATTDCVLQANALGLAIDIEGTEYDNEIKTEVDKNSSTQALTVTGTSSNVYGNNDSGLYNTVTTIVLDDDILVDESKVAVNAYYKKTSTGTEIAISSDDIAVDGNTITIAWGDDTSSLTDLTLYGYELTYEISGLSVTTPKSTYENIVSVTGKLYSSGIATDKPVGELAKEESYLEYEDLVVEKTWLDDNNSQSLRPDTFEVELYRDGTTEPIATYTIDTDKTTNVQTYTIPNLLVKDDASTYTYSIKEKEISLSNGDKYVGTIEGSKITNLLTGTTSKDAKVSWTDKENANDSRPSSLTVDLNQNGTKINGYTFDIESSEEDYIFENLPKYDANGKLYTYTISTPDSIEGYTTTSDGTTISNVLNKITYVVDYYFDDVIDSTKQEVIEVEFKDTVTNYTDKVIDGYELKNVETLPAVIDSENIVIKVYYTKRTDLTYTVKYVDSEGNSILEDKNVTGQTFKDVVTEQAPDIEGYNKVQTEASIEITTGENTITFEYTKRTDLSYTVNYLEKDSNAVLATEKVVENQTYLAEVSEEAIDITGYAKEEPTNQTIEIKVDGNVINFYYTKRTDLSYIVNYLEKETGAILDSAKTVENQTYLEEVTENAIDIDGYVKEEPLTQTITIDVENNVINFYYTKRTDLSYTVRYVEQGTNEVLAEEKVVSGQTFKSVATEQAIDINGYNKVKVEDSVEITTGENIITFEYTKRTDLSYTVKYVEQGTNEVLAEEKVVNGQTFKSVATEQAIDIKGYNKVKEEGSVEITTGENIITFEYTKRTDLFYTVNYLEKDSNVVLATEKVVENQTYLAEVSEEAIDIAGYVKEEPTSQTIEIQVDGNVINFYYTKRTDLFYTVNYLEKDSNAVLATEKVVENQTYLAEVTEEAIDITGYDKVQPTSQTIEIKVEGNVINFYYTKRTDLSYTVKFVDPEGNELQTEKIVGNQTFGDTVTEQAPDIEGYNKVVTEASTEITAGENVITFEYTKRTDLEYIVNYLSKDTNINVATSKKVSNQTYLDEVVENAIDIDGYVKEEPKSQTIEIKVEGNVINFYYTKRTDLSYTVKYVDPEGNELQAEKVVGNQTFGDTVTEQAPDIPGYNKVKTEDSTPITTGENIITFEYTKRTDLFYTVNYLEQGTNAILASAKTVENQTYLVEVTENAIDINGYDKVAPTEAKIIIDVENNVINFYYTKRTDLSYTVNYFEQGTESKLVDSKVVSGQTYLQEVTENAIDIEGYVKQEPLSQTIEIKVEENVINFYYIKRNDLIYTVNYLEKDTNEVLAENKVVANQRYLDEITEEAIDIEGYVKQEPLSQTIEIKVENNVINFYYTKRTDLSYTVKYLEDGTNEVLAEEKVVNNQTFNSSVTENAIDIEGYTKVNPTETIIIKVNDNEIIFYYKKVEGLSYIVKYLEKDTNTGIAPSKTIDGKVFEDVVTEEAIDIDGYDKQEPLSQTITIKMTANEIVFYYTKRTDLSYTVKYVDPEGNELQAEKVVGNQTFGDIVTEQAPDIKGYDKVKTEDSTSITTGENTITFEYKKRTDLFYTVNYLEKDTNTVLASRKTVENQTYLSEVTENAIDIDGYNKVAPISETIVIDVENNVINFYYTKKSDLSYTVKYVDPEGNVLREDLVVVGQVFGDSVTEQAPDIDGYNKVISEKTIEITTGTNIITFEYTKRTDLVYSIEYYYNGEIDSSKTENGIATFEDEINSFTDKVEAGYVFEKTENYPLTVGTNAQNNIIKIYYTTDDNQTKELSYTVEYYQNNSLVSEDTQIVTEVVQLLKPDVLDVNKGDINTFDKYYGYRLKETIPAEIPSEIATGSTIKVYYETDPNQTKELSYTIEFYKDGTDLQAADTVLKTTTKQVLESDTLNVDLTDVVIDGKYEGYKLDKTEPAEVPTVVNNGDVIKYFYIKDQFDYTVEYYYEGVLDASKTDTFTATYKDIIRTYEDKNIFGYREEKAESVPFEITANEENNVIKVYYIIDDGNTKTLKYTVEYYKDGVLQEFDTQVRTNTVQILEADTLIVDKTEINTTDKYEGYRFIGTEPIEIPDVVENGTTIKVNYEKDEYKYTVEYYYKGVLDAEKTVSSVAKYKEVIDSYENKAGEKYYLDKEENLPLTISVTPENNVIKVYYTKKASSITVKYQLEDEDFFVSQDVVINGEVDTIHTIGEALDIPEKYELVSGPESNQITMTVEPITITYKYRLKDAKVIVKHLEVGTDKLLAEEVIKGQVDDVYKTKNKQINGFKTRQDKNSDNLEGVMTLEPIIVKYYYEFATPAPVGNVGNNVGNAADKEVENNYKSDAKGNRPPKTGDSTVQISVAIIIVVVMLNIIQIVKSTNEQKKINKILRNGGETNASGRRHCEITRKQNKKHSRKTARISRIDNSKTTGRRHK